MKQTQRVTANYAADLAGVCSALYELGGLIVMHDASGCNSTYATHDEPRWYKMDSLVYISALEEYNMVLGDDQKYIDDVCEVAEEKHPKFIAVFGSPIALLCGTDFKGIARLIEDRTGIPTFGFDTSGMYTYQRGARQAFAALAERFVTEPASADPSGPVRVNLLGVTPLDFSVVGNVEGLRQFCADSGFVLQSCWAMGDSLDTLKSAASATVNLVVSSTGIDAAKILQEKFGIPYVIGLPCGRSGWESVAAAVREAAASGENVTVTSSPKGQDDRRILLIGEPVHCAALRACLETDLGCSNVKYVCPLEDDIGLLRKGDCMTDEEDDVLALANTANIVIADPIYKRVLEKDSSVRFVSFPQEGYSGRMYRADIPVFVRPNFETWLQQQL
ncbi:MAG: nitrogenase component 1 [Acutalibacteraceae bacterium]|nr:nitrogenase component 1 [Acutalibacteraceae bacterium]